MGKSRRRGNTDCRMINSKTTEAKPRGPNQATIRCRSFFNRATQQLWLPGKSREISTSIAFQESFSKLSPVAGNRCRLDCSLAGWKSSRVRATPSPSSWRSAQPDYPFCSVGYVLMPGSTTLFVGFNVGNSNAVTLQGAL